MSSKLESLKKNVRDLEVKPNIFFFVSRRSKPSSRTIQTLRVDSTRYTSVIYEFYGLGDDGGVTHQERAHPFFIFILFFRDSLFTVIFSWYFMKKSAKVILSKAFVSLLLRARSLSWTGLCLVIRR